MTQEFIQIGTGGRGAAWCEQFLQPNIDAGRIEPVAAVDVDQEALDTAKEHLGLSAEQCYTDAEAAFEDHSPEWCLVVTPPQFHEAVIDVAIDHGVDVLCVKPIADTLEASVRIAEKVKRADLKMGVTVSERYTQRVRTLHEELHSGDHGPLNYLTCQFTRDQRGETDTYRLQMDQPLVVDAAIHHLDFLRGFAGADPKTVFAFTWNQPWDNHEGDTNALVLVEFQNGVKAVYEGAKTNAIGLHPWRNEYVRAECRDATLLLDDGLPGHPDGIECFPYDSDTNHDGAWTGRTRGSGEVIPWLEGERWQDERFLDEFLDWRAGGDPMETAVDAHLPSMGLVHAVIESSRSGQPVNVPDMLDKAKAAVDGSTETQ